jgi:ABC-type bacteriocin/lantibiotic exporter with double-glycine peptidase domain
MELFKQKDKFSCGPIAILNVLNILGKNKQYSYLKKLQKLCNCTEKHPGTSWNDLTNTLIHLNLDNWTVKDPNLDSLDYHMDKGYVPIIMYRVNDLHEGHWATVLKRTKKYYQIINYYTDEKVSYISRKKLSKIFKNRYWDGMPKLVLVKNKKETPFYEKIKHIVYKCFYFDNFVSFFRSKLNI